MITKVLEVRDAATFIPVLAVKMQSHETREDYLLRRAGYSGGDPLILVSPLTGGGRAEYDPFAWRGNDTMRHAHAYIQSKFDELAPGAVIDVEYILGITPAPKVSERITSPLP